VTLLLVDGLRTDVTCKSMTRAYRTILQQGTTAYTRIVRHILEHPPPDNAFIMHCTAGKDRTGVLGALLLTLCGVSDEIVAEEYSLTEQGLGEWLEYLVQAVKTRTGVSDDAARKMAGSRKENMAGALKMMHAEFGGPEGYFTNMCGLKEEEVVKIKKWLIVDEKAVCGVN
jgi:protein tyrosine/serine phosphatase